jgi:hypothetical protein
MDSAAMTDELSARSIDRYIPEDVMTKPVLKPSGGLLACLPAWGTGSQSRIH